MATGIAVLTLAACQKAVAPAPAAASSLTAVVGVAVAGPDNRAVSGRVRLVDAKGVPVPGASATVGRRGQFAILLEERMAPADYQVVVEGGTHSGSVALDQMRADVRIAEKEHGPVYVTPLSTVAAEWMSRHPGASLKESRTAAKKALGVPEWAHHVNAAIWTEKYLSSSQLLADVQARGGFAAWSRAVVDVYEGGGTTPYPPATSSLTRGGPRTAAAVGAMGAGGFFAAVAWTVVANQAASCDPGSSSVPGIGQLGSMLNSSGFISTNPACANSIGSALAQIEQQLDHISSQVSAVGEMIDNLEGKLNLGTFMTGLQMYAKYKNAIVSRHADEVTLETMLATYLETCAKGTASETTIADLAGTVDANGTPTPSDYTCNDSSPASTHWTKLQSQAASNMSSMTSDSDWKNAVPGGLQDALQGFAGVQTSLPYLYWQWVANLPAVPLVTRVQIELYVDFVSGLGATVVARGLQEVASVRATDYALKIYDNTSMLRSDINNALNIKFSWYSSGAALSALIPTVQLPVALRYQPPPDLPLQPVLPGLSTLSTQQPVGPLLDITNGKAWDSACFDSPAPDLPPPPGQTLDTGSPSDCPTRGVIAWLPSKWTGNGSQWFMKRAPRNYGCPGGLFCGVWPSTDDFQGWDSTSWKRDPTSATAIGSIYWQRPITDDLQTLVTIAQNSAQQGSDIEKWLVKYGGGVLDGVADRPVATGTLMINCVPDPMNWGSYGDYGHGLFGWSCSDTTSPDYLATAFINFQRLSSLGGGSWGGASNMEGWDGACPNSGGVTFYQWQLPASFGNGQGASLDQARVEQTGPVDSWTFGTCGQGTIDQGVFSPYDLNQFRSVALLVGDVPDIQNYVPFYCTDFGNALNPKPAFCTSTTP